MYLNIALVDILSTNGELTTYRVVPMDTYNKVIIDRIRDINEDVRGNTDKDIAGIRIYNSNKCSMNMTKVQLNNFESNIQRIKFGFEHIGVPVGDSRCGEQGIYNFILPMRWKLSELYIIDPYDKKKSVDKEKRQFRYTIKWDSEKKIQLVEMDLRTWRGSFSFKVYGTALNIDRNQDGFINAVEDNINIICRNFNQYKEEDRKSILKILRESFMCAPNIYGIGVDLKHFISEVKK